MTVAKSEPFRLQHLPRLLGGVVLCIRDLLLSQKKQLCKIDLLLPSSMATSGLPPRASSRFTMLVSKAFKPSCSSVLAEARSSSSIASEPRDSLPLRNLSHSAAGLRTELTSYVL